MSGIRKRNTILGVTYFSLLVVASFVADRFMAWQHQGWSGLCYMPGALERWQLPQNKESEPKRLGYTPGGVITTFAGTPAEAAGIVNGDVVLAVNGVSTAEHERLAKLDVRLKLNDEITYQIKRKDGSQATIRMRLDSPLKSRQIRVSTVTGFAAALVFCALGTLVYWRKPEDPRALIFYLLSLVATIVFATGPLFYVDVFGAKGAKPLFVFTAAQTLLWTAIALLQYTVLVLIVHLALIFPRPRPVVQKSPQVLRWLYLAPLLDFVTVPTFAVIGLLQSAPRIGLATLWLLVLALLGYLVAKVLQSSSWKHTLGNRPISVLGTIALLIIASTSSLFLAAPSKAKQDLVADVFGLMMFAVMPLAIDVVYSIIACMALYRSYRESGVEEKRQVRWPLWGTMVSISGVLLVVTLYHVVDSLGMQQFLPLIAVEILRNAFFLIIPFCFAFAILKYRLMEIDILIRKTIIYSIVSGIVVVLYLALVGGLGGLLLTRAGVQSTWMIVFATLTVAAVFIPMRNKVQQIVDGRFFRRKDDLPRALRTLSLKTSETTDLPALLKLVAEHLVQVLKLRNAVIFRKSLREQDFQVAAKVGFPDQVDQIGFNRHTRLLASEEIAFQPPQSLPEAERRALKQLGTALLVPVRRQGETIGFMSLGSKLSDQEFESDEIEFLAAVADQTATAIYNLGLRKQAQEYEEAKEIQQGLLPKQIPQMPGLEISGSWRPARIVGGDYFDVFKLSESRLALCIGDVSGKGMPAALLMSNLQAIVRALASETLSPRELTEKINRAMFRNVTDGKFITFFYALIDSRRRRLHYSNAGHNAPILVRQDGTQLRLEEGGLVLGAFQESSYQQGEVELRPGDRLVLFTDGVTEATNGKEEEFGEERLVQALLCDRPLTAEALQNRLLDQVNEFSGGELEDDVTVLVLSVLRGEAAIAGLVDADRFERGYN